MLKKNLEAANANSMVLRVKSGSSAARDGFLKNLKYSMKYKIQKTKNELNWKAA